MLGYAENPKEEKWEKPSIINKTPARELLTRFRTDAQVDAAFAKLNEYWNTLLAKYAVDSADEKVTAWSISGPVSVYGHLQHVPFRFLLRSGTGTRHGLP